MFVIIVTHDSTEPWVYGPYKTINDAKRDLKRYKATWTNRDWDSMNAYIEQLKKRG
jgi:hypothetical protein